MLKLRANQETFYDNYVWDNFIPQDDNYVKIKGLINIEFIPDLVKDSYKNENMTGNDSCDPRTLFLMNLVQYIENLSDKKVVEKISRMPVLKWFVGLSAQDKVPDDTTLSKFRTQRMGEENFKEAFHRIVNQIKEMGLIDGQVQSQDATHINANIERLSPFQIVNKCRLRLLKAVKDINENKYEQLMKKYDFKLQRNPEDKQKHFDELLGVTRGLVAAVGRSGKLRADKKIQYELSIIDRVLEEREDEYYDDDGNKKNKDDVDKIKGKMVNPSDPDAVIGAKSDKKYFAGYKAEVNLDHLYDFITAIDVMRGNQAEEKYAADLLKEQKKYLGITPEHFMADAKFSYGTTRVELMAAGAKNIYIPEAIPKHRYNNPYSAYSFEWDWQLMNLTCPSGYPSEIMIPNDEALGFEFIFNKSICKNCKSRKQCTGAANSGRRVLIPHTWWDHKEGYRIMLTDEYKLMYKEQRYKIERKNADMKMWHDFEKARYRGLSRVKIHAYLTALAVNVKKWIKFTMGKLKNGIKETLSKLAAIGPPIEEVSLKAL